jgi:hypothetical protein
MMAQLINVRNAGLQTGSPIACGKTVIFRNFKKSENSNPLAFNDLQKSISVIYGFARPRSFL